MQHVSTAAYAAMPGNRPQQSQNLCHCACPKGSAVGMDVPLPDTRSPVGEPIVHLQTWLHCIKVLQKALLLRTHLGTRGRGSVMLCVIPVRVHAMGHHLASASVGILAQLKLPLALRVWVLIVHMRPQEARAFPA